jgi:hypothetical protein
MDGGQHGPPRREEWFYHHPSSKPILVISPLPSLPHDNLESSPLTRLSAACRDFAGLDVLDDRDDRSMGRKAMSVESAREGL